ncbi:MAG: dephospho-CoA kinase [Planctomycetes bacterium]|nr:dephospho-CoA kinase [Planctomycetota bacterium]
MARWIHTTSPAAQTPDTATGRPLTILIQGGIASGKSTISQLLAERGAEVLDCDRIAHEQLEDPEVRDALREAFGAGVFADDGTVSRPKLGGVVFSDPRALAQLEALVHPRVANAVRAHLAARARPAGEPRAVVVVDAAVADKMQLVERYDVRVFVDASQETRAARAAARGWAPGELERRERNQEALETKRSRASYVLTNEGGLEQAAQRVAELWDTQVEPQRRAS